MTRMSYQQTPLRIAWRYVAGRPLDGYPRTDASWLIRGTVPVDGTRRSTRWSLLPGWQRTAWRMGVPAVAVAGTWAWYVHPVAMRIALMIAGTVAVAYAAVRIYRGFIRWRHRRTYVVPLHRVLSGVLGVSHPRPERWLLVPPKHLVEGVETRIMLPRDVNCEPKLRQAVRQVVEQKLGLHDPDETWHTIGAAPYVLFRPAPRPPASVTWGEIRARVEQASATTPVLGIGARSTVVDADLNADSPHILVSAGSGGGKSVLIRLLLAQGLHYGAGAVIVDYKRSSQRWADGLPGVRYVKDIDDIHNTLIEAEAECERRNRAADTPDGFVGHRIFLVIEEWNALAAKLNMYWQKVRTNADPKRSPAVDAISSIAFMGRHVQINLMGVAQMMTARTTGGPETRENFATRCLTRYTVNAWKMLAPEVWPMPKRSRTVGRWQIVKAGEAYETQVAYLTDDEAREWALSGVANPVEALSQVRLSQAVSAAQPVSEPVRTLVGLRDAAESLGLSLPALRKASNRDRRFPLPHVTENREHLYDLVELQAWKRRKDGIHVVRRDAA